MSPGTVLLKGAGATSVLNRSGRVGCVATGFSEKEFLNTRNTMENQEEPDKEVIRLQWEAEQEQLKKHLKLYDDFQWTFVPRNQFNTPNSNSSAPNTLRYIGGTDISFGKADPNEAVASLVVLSYPQLNVVYKNFKLVKMTKPYIAGFLAFREVEHIIQLIEEMKMDKNAANFIPQVILVDGNGILHQRGFGLACHLGVLTDIPTIGVAKKLLFVDGIDKGHVKTLTTNHLVNAGDVVKLQGMSGKIHGAIIKSTNDTLQPVFVSPGHKICMDTTIAIVKECCLYRVPEPTRQADILSREHVRIHIDKSQQVQGKK